MDYEDSQVQKLWQAVIGRAVSGLRDQGTSAAGENMPLRGVQGEAGFPSDPTDHFAEVWNEG